MGLQSGSLQWFGLGDVVALNWEGRNKPRIYHHRGDKLSIWHQYGIIMHLFMYHILVLTTSGAVTGAPTRSFYSA